MIKNMNGDLLFDGSIADAVKKGANLEGANLEGAYLRGANLEGAYLRGAYLEGANLKGAYLEGANLEGANLEGAYLRGAYLRGANLKNANFYHANLKNANLEGANLEGANLKGAYLEGAYLRGANLEGARLPATDIVPQEGPFYGYKKVSNNIVLTLYIPRSAQRLNAYSSRKCRASKVKVVKAEDANGKEILSNKDIFTSAFASITASRLEYNVGKWVKPDKFDPDKRVECTSGIHFFITKQEAIEY